MMVNSCGKLTTMFDHELKLIAMDSEQPNIRSKVKHQNPAMIYKSSKVIYKFIKTTIDEKRDEMPSRCLSIKRKAINSVSLYLLEVSHSLGVHYGYIYLFYKYRIGCILFKMTRRSVSYVPCMVHT